MHAPGLLGPWPRALLGEVARGLDLPGLVGILARARFAGRRRAPRGREPREGPPESFERLAFGAFGYPPGPGDDVPAAALMWAEDGGGRPGGAGAAARPGSSPAPLALLRADPVHLRPDLDAARLFDSSHFSLSRAEAGGLAGALDRHFAPEGLRVEALHPARWYLRLERPADAVFHPPGAVVGRSAGGRLPAGNEGALWRRRMNEAQMVLHAHPVNEARERRGELPINSVWFWGAGVLGAAPRPRFQEVFADDPLVRSLGLRVGARVRDLVERAEAVGEAAGPDPGPRLVAPGAGFYRAVHGRDVESWRRELLAAEEDWFHPLAAAMRAGRARRVIVDAGLRTGQAVAEAAGRRARASSVPLPEAGLAAFLLAGDA